MANWEGCVLISWESECYAIPQMSKNSPVIYLLDTYVVWIWFVLKAAQRYKIRTQSPWTNEQPCHISVLWGSFFPLAPEGSTRKSVH